MLVNRYGTLLSLWRVRLFFSLALSSLPALRLLFLLFLAFRVFCLFITPLYACISVFCLYNITSHNGNNRSLRSPPRSLDAGVRDSARRPTEIPNTNLTSQALATSFFLRLFLCLHTFSLPWTACIPLSLLFSAITLARLVYTAARA